MLNEHGEEIGGIVKTFRIIYRFVSEFGAENIVIVTSEYKSELKLRGENRYYCKDDEDKIKNYINQKMILENLLRFLGVTLVDTEEYFSRQIIYTLVKSYSEKVKMIITEDVELAKLLPSVMISNYRNELLPQEAFSFWKLCIKGYPFFLSGIDCRSKKNFSSLEEKKIKTIDDFLCFLKRENGVSNYFRKRLLGDIHLIEKNYNYLSNGFFSGQEVLLKKYEKNEELLKKTIFKHGLQKGLPEWL